MDGWRTLANSTYVTEVGRLTAKLMCFPDKVTIYKTIPSIRENFSSGYKDGYKDFESDIRSMSNAYM